MENKDEERRRCRAFHEAGHAVVARVCGGYVKFVTISDPAPDLEGSEGYCEWVLDGDAEDAVLSQLAVALAGPFTAKVAGFANWLDGYVDDQRALSRTFQEAHPDESLDGELFNTLKSEARARAISIINRNEPAIRLLADLLLEKGSLSGDEVRMVIDPVIDRSERN